MLGVALHPIVITMAATTKITDPQEIVEAVKIIEAQLDTYLKVKTNSGTFLVGPNKVDGQKDPVRANVIDNGAAVQMTGMRFKVKKSAEWGTQIVEDTKRLEDNAVEYNLLVAIGGIEWVKVMSYDHKYEQLNEVKDWKNYKYEAGI